jgi:hypothetical protein
MSGSDVELFGACAITSSFPAQLTIGGCLSGEVENARERDALLLHARPARPARGSLRGAAFYASYGQFTRYTRLRSKQKVGESTD